MWTEGAVVRGRYRILSQIGKGGMATVYKAEHIHFREVRALKAINPEFTNDASFVRRFTQEAIITRSLQHPHAVRVDDIDQAEDGSPFIVMEYLEGQSLKEAMQAEGPMPVARACAIVKQVAAALGAAHALGMVHRDIKPANIFLVAPGSNNRRPSPGKPGGEIPGETTISTSSPSTATAIVSQPETASSAYTVAKVLDFGIAKIMEGHLEDSRLARMTLTGTGMVVGTVAYMSPEQAMGRRGNELDGRSDLYSLGVMMYEMLTGDLPLKADSDVGFLVAHVNSLPAPIRSRRPEVPEPVARIVMQCLEKDRNKRPASDEAMIAAIESWERGASTSGQHAEDRLQQVSETISAPSPGQRSTRRMSTTAMIAAGCVLFIACAFGLWYHMSKGGGGTAPPVNGAMVPATVAPATVAPQGTTGQGGQRPGADGAVGSTAATGLPAQGAPRTERDQHPAVRPATRPSPPRESPLSSPVGAPQEVAPPKPKPAGETHPSPAVIAPSVTVTGYMQTSESFADLGKYDKAIQECREGLKAYPGNDQLQQCVEKMKNRKEAEERALSPN